VAETCRGAKKEMKLCAVDGTETSVYKELQEICLTLNRHLSHYRM